MVKGISDYIELQRSIKEVSGDTSKSKEQYYDCLVKKLNNSKTSPKTESSHRGAVLYIDHHINYKVHNNLKMYKAKELESIFTEILNQNSKNTIIGCICQHPCRDPIEFNDV